MVVFTDNLSVSKQIASNFSLPINQLSAEKIRTHSVKNSIVIFDMASLKFKDTIDFIKKYNNHNNSFRFKPKNQDFLIGSDSKGRWVKLNI